MELELVNLLKDFSGVKAVNNISAKLRDGKLTGLLGPSGCGKSTLLYLISGLEKPTSGSILFDGKDVTGLQPQDRGIGLVFQNYALYPHLTVEQNIRFPLDNIKLDKSEKHRRTMEMAKLTQIEDILHRKPSQISGGQQQRVAVARALVKQPRVLLLDEPLSNLDARLRLEMREEIRRIQTETGVTTVFVTHDQEDAMSITDEILLMKEGVIQQQAAPQHMYLEPENQFVASFLGNPKMNFLPETMQNGVIRFQNSYGLKFNTDYSGEVVVGIRPETWGLGEGMPIHVEGIEIRGRDQLITFTLDGARARAILDTSEILPADGNISLRLKNKHIFLFNGESGERLRWEVCA